MPQRQEYKKYQRDLKNIMRRSNRHPRRKFQRLEKIEEKLFEEIMPKNFQEPKKKKKRFKFTNIKNYVFLLSAIRRIIVKL